MLVRNLEMKTLIVTLLYVTFLCGFIFTQSSVRKPPSITRGPYTKEFFRENQEVTLPCKAEGTPPLTYVWKKNGEKLNLNHTNIRRGSDGDVRIRSAARMDEGFYQCFATNQYGTALSTVAHIQMAFLERASQSNIIVNLTVPEGRPFVIQAARRDSFPIPTYNWEITTSDVDPRPRPFDQSRRVQSVCNGDLYVAYALKADELGGSIYKNTVFNANIDVRSGGSYTRVMVTQGSGSPPDFPPNITYFKSQEVAVKGGSIELKCFFSGKPVPEITWSGPRNNLPSGRIKYSTYKTELTISNISESDEGDYVCTATNTIGAIQYTHNILVEAVPIFRRESDGPRNVNVTEGESVTFNCSAVAKPNATVVWLRNGQPIDVSNPPSGFVFSNDNKSLTIRDVCRDCVDRESKTDLMVIQCNASNVHGYAFAQGYLNVLFKTRVLIRGPKRVSVDFLEEKQFIFQCYATSDPSTPSTVGWYKTEPFGDFVRSRPPYVYVTNDILVIMISPNCSSECAKYLGEYRCIGDNGYSRDIQTITLSFQYRPPTDEKNEETCTVWKIILGAIGLVLFLIGVYLGFRSKRIYAINGGTKDRKLPNLPSMYERIDYASVGIPLEGIGNNGRSMRREYSMYEKIGYDSIDQVLEEIRNREGTTSHQPNVHRFVRYESTDTSQVEAINRGRRLLDEDTKYDDLRYTIPQEEVVNRTKIDENQVHGYESLRRDSNKFPNSEVNPYLDLCSAEVNPYLNLGKKEVNPYLDMGKKEVNPYLDMGKTEVNPNLDMGKKEENPYLDMGKKEVNFLLDKGKKEVKPYLDMGQKDVNPYLDMGKNEVNLYLDVGQKEVNPNLDMGKKEMDPNVYMTLDPIRQPASPALREADYLALKN